MKRIYLFLFFFCCFLPATMGGTLINNNLEDEIDLKGNLSGNKSKSLQQPIQAFITGQFIQVNFNASLGTIALSIYDETGNAVYQQSVSTYAGQQLFIDITSFDTGVYTIEFVNSRNEYLSGEFEI